MSTKNTIQNNKSRRIKPKHLLGLLAIAALVTIIAVTTVVIMQRDDEPIPLTDLAATYKGEIKDVDGNLLVPFDVAYPEAFASGAYEYRKDALLLKMTDNFSGRLTRDLQKCGFISIEPVVETAKGTWYEAKVAEGEDVTVVIQRARSLSKVLMADFDYVIKTTDSAVESTGNEGSVDGINEKVLGNGQLKNQWFLKSAGIQNAWKELEKKGIEPGGLSSVVVAVIDTGVDYTHPDLKDNIWVNASEIPDNGRDDDGNGYVDDYYGYNAVANRGSGMDVHGHGTHVAGIIAASNNKEGVVGIAYNAKIMPITAGQATGIFLQNDIAEAIIYAYEMGADVINMSFGGGACSIAVQDALMTAYTRSTLVAAAGNAGDPNQPTDHYPDPMPNYPGALSYVIGVMSVNQSGVESGFTNWDVYAFNSLEYEVYAPGEGIYSTLAGGSYGNMSGTSMATPVVSGIAALLRSYFTDRDMYPSKFIQAQLCATSGDSAICCDPENHEVGGRSHNIPMIVNAYDALTKLPKPEVNLYDYYIFDGEELSDKNNGDGVADAGETLDIVVVLRNRWGMSKDTVITIDSLSSLPSGNVANPYVELLIDSVNYDSVGTYSTKSTLTYGEDGAINGYDKPLRVKISEDCPNDYRIGLNVTVTCGNALDAEDENTYITEAKYGISFDVRSGMLLPSQITEDMTLTKNNLYIIPNAMFIHEGVTVTVEPGTRIQFWSDDPQDVYAQTAITYLMVEGNFICQGSEEEPVELFPSDLMSKYRVEIKRTGSGRVDLSYTTVTNPYLDINTADHCTFRQNYIRSLSYRYLDGGVVRSDSNYAQIFADTVTNSIIYKCGTNNQNSHYYSLRLDGTFDTCAFVDSQINYSYSYGSSTYAILSSCAFIGNYATDEIGDVYVSSLELGRGSRPSISEIVRDAQTGTTYMMIGVSGASNSSRTGFAYAQAFAKAMGGELACIETAEEAAFMKSQQLEGIVGLINGSDTWLSGAPVRKDMHIASGSYYAGYYDAYYQFYDGNQYHYRENCAFNSSNSYVLIEIPGSIYCDTIGLDAYSAEIDMESGFLLRPTVIPATFDVKELIYVSEDPAVATVDENGKVTPVSKGETRIFAYAPDYGCHAVMTLKVVDKVKLEGITLGETNTTIKVGDTFNLAYTLTPANTTERLLSFASSDEKVLTVDERGNVRATGIGTATVTVTGANGVKATYTAKVIEPVESISFTDKFYVTFMGDTDTTWKPTVLPADASEYTLTWLSSNPEIAYVDESGKLIRKATGSTTLRAQIEGTDLYADLNVNVNETELLTDAKVIEMEEADGFVYAVTDDGSLWVWGNGALRLPVKAAEGVKDVIPDGTATGSGSSKSYGSYILKLDGAVERGKINVSTGKYSLYDVSSQTAVADLTNVIALERNSSSRYALRADGTVWAWGSNSSGQLGDGTTAERSVAVQMGVTNVKKIVAFGASVMLLTNDGKAYCYGTTNRYTEAYLVSDRAADIRGSYYTAIVETMDGEQIYVFYNNSKPYTISNYTDWTYYDDNSTFRIKGESVYWKSTTLNCPGMEEIVGLFGSDNDLFYYRTTDGKLYGVGSNGSFQLADLTATSRNTPTRIFLGLGTQFDAPVVENVNLAEGLLIDGTLTVDFNKALLTGNAYGYIKVKDSASNMLSLEKTLVLDKLTIAPVGGWKHGETYVLTIPVSAMLDMFGNNIAEIEYTFTYTNTEPIAGTGASIADGAVLADPAIDLHFDYTVANRGELFDAIAITKNGEAVQGITVTLAGNKLTLAGTLDYGDYVLTIPAGALCDNVGGVNTETVINFSVVHTLKLIDTSVEDGQLRVDERENITLTFEGALQGEKFGEIALTDESGIATELTVTLADGVLTVAHGGLEQGKAYVLTVPAGALVDAIGTVNLPITIHFTTYAPAAITHASLEAGNKNAALLPQFVFIYNGAFTLDQSKMKLTAPDGSTVALDLTVEGDRLVATPAQALTSDTEYVLTLAEGLMTDERGALSPAAAYTFATVNVTERYFWNNNDVKALIDQWIKGGYNNSNFYGNAILNNFQDTNVEHWLRVTANEYSPLFYTTTGVAGNWWGTTNEELIGLQILDFDDYQSLHDINFKNYLTKAPETTFPFVVDAYLLNKDGERVDRVSNETVTFVVEFNRDMDTTVPLRVRFGSSKPFAEYEIMGEYVSARRWEGTYTLKTTIENGRQRINIENGRAADDHYLQLFETDSCRFGFEIDTTGAQAMMMQATATETGIQLSWMQDDFDTLAGYNVYRATSEDGYYQRLNEFVIPADITEFFDDTVEPGVRYYYNFTVVKTDFNESAPSGKINLMSLDTMAPGIYHSPVHQAFTAGNLIISATVTDNLVLREVKLFYRTTGTDQWTDATMTNHNDRWSAVVPVDHLSTDGLEYYIRAYDGINYTYSGSETAPYAVTVQLAIDASAKGDVNGDGVITNIDALMLLQAANDKLNLTAEQFLRADLNDDGELSAAEALRILKYANGSITTLMG